MKITILNGNSDINNTDYEAYLEKLIKYLKLQKHEVGQLVLRNMDIKNCTGCWGCWVKTPGRCLFKDESDTVCEQMIRSDLVILASPMVMGFIDAILKKAMDKMIPLVHPYIELVQGECHHKMRYDSYPKIGLILDPGSDEVKASDPEDLEITIDIFRRFTLNFKSELSFVGYANGSIKEVIHEIDNI